MKRLEPEIIDYYNNEVVLMMAEKYGLSQMDDLDLQCMTGRSNDGKKPDFQNIWNGLSANDEENSGRSGDDPVNTE